MGATGLEPVRASPPGASAGGSPRSFSGPICATAPRSRSPAPTTPFCVRSRTLSAWPTSALPARPHRCGRLSCAIRSCANRSPEGLNRSRRRLSSSRAGAPPRSNPRVGGSSPSSGIERKPRYGGVFCCQRGGRGSARRAGCADPPRSPVATRPRSPSYELSGRQPASLSKAGRNHLCSRPGIHQVGADRSDGGAVGRDHEHFRSALSQRGRLDRRRGSRECHQRSERRGTARSQRAGRVQAQNADPPADVRAIHVGRAPCPAIHVAAPVDDKRAENARNRARSLHRFSDRDLRIPGAIEHHAPTALQLHRGDLKASIPARLRLVDRPAQLGE